MNDPTPSWPSASDREADWGLAIFAHNEADFIASCLATVARAVAGRRAVVFVLANGCTDGTAAAARAFAAQHGELDLRVVEIALGDKANAWNLYVHELRPRARCHFFVDGDTRPTPGSFAVMAEALARDAYAQAASGVPAGGRSAARWRAHVLRRHAMPGPLYCLRGEAVERVRALGLRLPVGLIGDDIIVPLLIKTDFLAREAMDLRRVHPCAAATFAYDSFSLLRPRDWRLYFRRRVRNSLRHFQNQILISRLRAEGLAAMPAHVASLYRLPEMRRLRPRLTGVDALFDILALRRIATTRGSGG